MARFRKRGETWFAIFYDRNGRRCFKSTKCGDLRAAKVVAGRLEREAQDPDHAAKNEATITGALEAVIDHMQELVGAGRRSPATAGMHREKAGHIKRIFETKPDGQHVPFRLASIAARHVDTYISQRRAETAAENTIAKELVTLRVALKLAKRRGEWDGQIDAVLPSRFAPEYKPRTRWLTVDEMNAMLENLTPDHAARVAFAVATSANQGETRRAMRGDLGDSAVFIRGTKRTSRLRTVPVVCEWQRALIEHASANAQGEEGKLLLRDKGFRSALLRACRDAGIAPCSSNDLRRTFCHWMRQSGVPRELVAAAMGHGSTAMVDKVYGKLTTEELAMMMARAAGTPVAQTKAAQADFSDSAHDASGEKSNDMVPEEGLEPTLGFPNRILSPAIRPPKPREFLRKRSYGGASGTPAARSKAAGVVVVFPATRAAKARGGV